VDHLPAGLKAALRDADWPAVVRLGLAHAAVLRERLEARSPGTMATAAEAPVRAAPDHLRRNDLRGTSGPPGSEGVSG
jgi:hypothetical protein